jgi:hypothetical protein
MSIHSKTLWCNDEYSDRRLLAYSWITRSTQIIAPAIGSLGSLVHGQEVLGFTFDKFAWPALVMVRHFLAFSHR